MAELFFINFSIETKMNEHRLANVNNTQWRIQHIRFKVTMIILKKRLETSPKANNNTVDDFHPIQRLPVELIQAIYLLVTF